jgi:phosphonate metabolism-associated iron-containing alcohol dehydrogenase
VWTYHNPVRIRFGAGAFGELGRLIAGRRYMLVTYSEPLFQELAKKLGEVSGAPVLVIDDVKPNPDRADLAVQCQRVSELEAPPELVVAVGGGSVIDTAKVIAAARGSFGPVWDVLISRGQGADRLNPLPIIAVPTTAGTGSEVTSWATVWDGAGGKKYSLAAHALHPVHAVLDPDLTLSCPKGLTISTALDALSHALESIWNRNANPVSALYAVAAAREILEVLPALSRNLSDRDLRSRMLRAAMFSGLAFSNTKTAIAHSMSYPVTLRYGTAHGVACSFTLPMVLRSVIGINSECDAALARIFGSNLEEGAARLQGFLEELGVSTRPADHGVGRDEWRAIVEEAVLGERGQNFIGSKEGLLAQID